MALNSSQYNEIMRDYSKKQLKATSECQARRQTIYSKIPELTSIEDEIASASIAYAKSKIFNSSSEEDLHKHLEELRNKKSVLLAKFGYSFDDLEPRFQCIKCKDTGFIGAKKCQCFKQAENALIYRQSNLNDRSAQECFANFDLNYYDRNIAANDTCSPYEYAKKALLESENFVNNFSTQSANLLIYGETGVGKTFLCNSIATELLSQGFSVVYLTAKELFDVVSKAAFGKDYESKSHLDNLYKCDLLIIDDLGTEYSNNFTSTNMYYIINERLLSNKATVISSNLSIQDLQDIYSERVSSRIVGNYQILKLLGQDIRLAKRLK